MSALTITVDGISIAYQEINADGAATIFFIHGNSGSSRTWARQLNDDLLKDYRLVAFDLPAHGNSSASANPETDYSLIGLGRIVVSAIEALSQGKPFTLVGFSLGTNVVAEALAWITAAGSRAPSGIVLSSSSVTGGSYTMDKIFQPGTEGSILFSDAATPESIRAFALIAGYHPSDADMQVTIEDYDRVKTGFRPTLMSTVMAGKLSNEPDLLIQARVPVLVIFGRQDRLVKTGYLNDAPFQLWKGQVFELAEAGHTAHIDQPALWNQLLAEYIVSVMVTA